MQVGEFPPIEEAVSRAIVIGAMRSSPQGRSVSEVAQSTGRRHRPHAITCLRMAASVLPENL